MAPKLPAETGDADDLLAFLVQPPEQFVDHPIGCDLGVAGLVRELRQHRLEEVRALALGHQHARIIRREAELGDEARLLLVRQFRQVGLQLVDIGLA